MELNKATIGSYRKFEEAARKAMYWKLADVFFIAWAVLVLSLIPFALGVKFAEFIAGI